MVVWSLVVCFLVSARGPSGKPTRRPSAPKSAAAPISLAALRQCMHNPEPPLASRRLVRGFLAEAGATLARWVSAMPGRVGVTV